MPSKPMKAGKRNTANNTKVKVSRGNSVDAKFGPKKVGNVGSSVSDGAGTRERAGLPPETVAIKAPKATIPAGVQQFAAKTMPVPGVEDKLINVVEPWDLKRDRGLGNTRMGTRMGKDQ